MNAHRELAYIIDPALWVREALGIEPAPWQDQFLRAKQGASIIVLTARQVGKTTVAGWNAEIFAVESGLAEGPLLLRKEFFTEEPADVSGGLQPEP